MSFHIMRPYLFCSDILPYYFKHKNLSSLIRQLNMCKRVLFLAYFLIINLDGFRKNTPIDRSGMVRAESDQDHLEFFHPYFRRDHPELLINIRRKVSNPLSKQPQQLQLTNSTGMVSDANGESRGEKFRKIQK